jgi:hypothetical protein
MRMIKIILRNKSEIVVDEYKFDAILASPLQIIELTGYNGERLYRGFNKADIAEFMLDVESTKQMIQKLNTFERLNSEGKVNRLQSELPEVYAVGNYYQEKNDLIKIQKRI